MTVGRSNSDSFISVDFEQNSDLSERQQSPYQEEIDKATINIACGNHYFHQRDYFRAQKEYKTAKASLMSVIICEYNGMLDNDRCNLLQKYTDLCYILGIVYHHNGLYGKAIEHFEEVLRLDVNFPDVFCSLADAYFKNGMNVAARKNYKSALTRNPDSVMAHYGMGVLEYANNNYKTAIAYFNRALEIDECHFEATYNRAQAYHAISKLDLALADYNHIISVIAKKHNIPNNRLAKCYADRGYLHLDLDNVPSAIADYILANQMNPHDFIIAHELKTIVRGYGKSELFAKFVLHDDQDAKIRLFSQALNAESVLGRQFREKKKQSKVAEITFKLLPGFFCQDRFMNRVRKYYSAITRDHVAVACAARLMTQAQSLENCNSFFYGMPRDVRHLIAANVAKNLDKDTALLIAKKFMYRPG